MTQRGGCSIPMRFATGLECRDLFQFDVAYLEDLSTLRSRRCPAHFRVLDNASLIRIGGRMECIDAKDAAPVPEGEFPPVGEQRLLGDEHQMLLHVRKVWICGGAARESSFAVISQFIRRVSRKSVCLLYADSMLVQEALAFGPDGSSCIQCL